MQVPTGNQQIPQQVNGYYYPCYPSAPQQCQPCQQVQQPVQQPVQNPSVPAQQPVQYPVQNTCVPAQQTYPQSYVVTQQPTPNASGVNIQIFNPAVSTPGSAAPVYNVNAPSYPPNYYTQQMCPCQPNGSGQGATDGTGGTGGNGQGGTNGPDGSGTNGGVNGPGQNGGSDSETKTSETETSSSSNGKKTEKRKIVQLSDNYIKSLENYLNSQDKSIRLSAAKDVYARLEEDPSRHNDIALTALINKMLQDPEQEIRLLALSAIESRIVDGNDYTVNVLQKMQSSKDAYGQDAADAANALLKMAGKVVEKEFEVDDNSTKTKKKTESTKTTKG